MEKIRDKFTIRFVNGGLIITDKEGNNLEFSSSEALMLLDILKEEEAGLRKSAEEGSPVPFKIET